MERLVCIPIERLTTAHTPHAMVVGLGVVVDQAIFEGHVLRFIGEGRRALESQENPLEPKADARPIAQGLQDANPAAAAVRIFQAAAKVVARLGTARASDASHTTIRTPATNRARRAWY